MSEWLDKELVRTKNEVVELKGEIADLKRKVEVMTNIRKQYGDTLIMVACPSKCGSYEKLVEHLRDIDQALRAKE